MTTTTMNSVSRKVLTTSSIALWMYSVASYAMVAVICAGSSFWIAAHPRIFLITSRELALGSAQMPMKTAVSPVKATAVS